MIVTNTHFIEGRRILAYHGIVGIGLDHETIFDSMMKVSVSGTAVSIN